ncbi:PAAR domain-containing protein [Paraburkholderia sp. BL18I3N2]|uniref:PAAR domain-containing protein n=1 Tax=Paraburkholderia sp. BL18I3N2 TaxID=1938799 RepID=UPI0015E71F10
MWCKATRPRQAGLVIGGSGTHMTDHGKPSALDGDEATCGRCQGVFRIAGTATRRRYKGQASVVEGDLVLCPCGLNPCDGRSESWLFLLDRRHCCGCEQCRTNNRQNVAGNRHL